MAIEDTIEALKALVARIIPKKPEPGFKPYNPGTSDELERRRANARWAYAIHLRNLRSSGHKSASRDPG
jgi:hypothetical protein